jgi:hypothetical protein
MVDIRIKDLADGSGVLDDTDLLAFDSGADGTRRVTLAGLRSTMLANGVTLVHGGSDWILGVATPGAAVVGRSIAIVAATGGAGAAGGSLYLAAGEGGTGAAPGGDVLIDGGGGTGAFGDVLIGGNDTTAQVLIKGAFTEIAAAEVRANAVTIKGVQAGLGSVVIEAVNAASSIRCNIAGTEMLRVDGTRVLVPDVGGIGWLGSPTTKISQSGGLISIDSVGVTKLQIGSASALFSVNASPNAAGVRDLGASGLEWRYLYLSDGALANPALRFNDSSGVYQPATDQVAISIAGSAQAMLFAITGARAPSGSVANPSYAFTGAASSGLFITGPSQMGMSVNATQTALITALMNNATGDQVGWDMAVTVNKATSGSYTAIKMDVTETAAPGTDDRLLDLRVGGASKMRVSNAGVVRGEELQSTQYVRKAITESVTSSTTPQDDDALFCTLLAGGMYHFKFGLFVNTANAAEGLRLKFGGTATWTSVKLQYKAWDDGTNAFAAFERQDEGSITSSVAFALGAGNHYVEIEGTGEVNAGGTIRLMFAQNVSGGNAVSVQLNSWLLVSRCA